MTSKILIAGLVALAFFAGSVMTESAVFADKDDKKDKKGNSGIIAALQAIADAINGIDPNVTVDTPVTVEVPSDSIQVDVVGLQGPVGDKGLTGDKGATGDKGPSGDVGSLLIYTVEQTIPFIGGQSGGLIASCEPGDIATGGGGNAAGGVLIASDPVPQTGTPTAWRTFVESSTGSPSFTLKSYVVCIDLTP